MGTDKKKVLEKLPDTFQIFFHQILLIQWHKYGRYLILIWKNDECLYCYYHITLHLKMGSRLFAICLLLSTMFIKTWCLVSNIVLLLLPYKLNLGGNV
jgi:hypothetical protein